MALNAPNLEAATLSLTSVNNSRQAIIGGSNTSISSNNTQVIGPSNNITTINPTSGKLFLKDNPVLIKTIITKNVAGIITSGELSNGIINFQVSGAYTLDTTVNIRNRMYDNTGTPFTGFSSPMFEVTFYNVSGGNININPGTGQVFTNATSIIIPSNNSTTLRFWLTSSTTMKIESVSATLGVNLISAGGNVSLVNDGTGPTLANKGLTSGTGISLIDGGTQVTINNTSPASSVSLTSTGGTVSIVNDGIGPTLTNKGLTSGTGISLTDGGTQVIITNLSPASSVTLNNASIPLVGEAGLVVDGTGPTLSIKKLVGGAGVSLTNNLNDVVISSSRLVDSSAIINHGSTTEQAALTIIYPASFLSIPSTIISLSEENTGVDNLEKRLINYNIYNEGINSFDAVINLKANHIVTVDSPGNIGSLGTSLSIVDGKPCIAYHDDTNGDLKFARNSNADGTGTWLVLIANTSFGDWPSLEVIEGKPAISFRSVGAHLSYLRANNKEGTSWPNRIVVDNTGNVGVTSSLKYIDGRPAIAHTDLTNNDLKYVRANNSTGSSWPVSTAIATAGIRPSMTVVQGNPAIAYYQGINNNLRYIRATDSIGSTWGASILLDSAGDVGNFPSLVVVDGNPAISYYDATNGNLKYIRANDSTGSSWPIVAPGLQIIDNIGNVGRHLSMTLVDGNPAIAYNDNTNGNLKYIRANDSTGISWPTTAPGLQVVDSTGNVGTDTSLAVIDGNPAISYRDITNTSLKFARSGLTDNFAEDASYKINYFAST